MLHSTPTRRLVMLTALVASAVAGIRLYPSANAHYQTLTQGSTLQHHATITLPHIQTDASGIAYQPHTKSLFIIRSKSPAIYEINTNGTLLRTITLPGFKDTEGITWVSGNEFAVIEERTCSIVLVNLAHSVKHIERSHAQTIEMPSLNTSNQNKGCEDIAWHPSENSFYVAKEKHPAAVYRAAYDTYNQAKIARIIDNAEFPIIGSDLSGLHFDRSQKSLLMLSDESRKVTQLNHTDDPTTYSHFNWFNNGLIKPIAQAEGVTMDEKGNLFIVSEPNLLYIFKPKNQIN